MASRLFKGQASVPCQICKGKNRLKWFCIDCELDSSSDDHIPSRKFILCEECKIRHRLVPATSSHNILSFNDIDSCAHDELIKGKIKRTKCRKHPEETYRLFCTTCNFLVCSSCVSKYHTGHHAVGIDSFIAERLRQNGKELSNRLPARFLARSPSEDRDFQIQNGTFVFTQEQLPVDISQTEEQWEVVNDPGHGQIDVIKTAVANVPCVYFLKTVSTDIAWIGCPEMDLILQVRINISKIFQTLVYKFQLDDLECKEVNEVLGAFTRDIAILKDGKILMVTKNSFKINTVSTTSIGGIQINEFCSFKPLLPIAVCVEKGGEQRIWVALKEDGEDFTLRLNSIRRLVEVSNSGRINKIIEKTKAKKRLFTIPWRIIHFDDRLCILDRTHEKTGRVISVRITGHLMWCYNPEISILNEKQFYPTGLAALPSGKILIIDAANRLLHILNIDGELILKQSMRDLGIPRPFSIDIDRDEQIWIGSAGSDIKDKSKLYVLKFI